MGGWRFLFYYLLPFFSRSLRVTRHRTRLAKRKRFVFLPVAPDHSTLTVVCATLGSWPPWPPLLEWTLVGAPTRSRPYPGRCVVCLDGTHARRGRGPSAPRTSRHSVRANPTTLTTSVLFSERRCRYPPVSPRRYSNLACATMAFKLSLIHI